ncbi:MAG TPA: hypothetical protein VGL27_08105, partial [Negativicutes bacterium]
VLATLAALSLVTSVGFASPLNDFSQGKVAVDISARPSNDFKISDSTGSATYDGKTSWEYGLTVGLGNNLAFQYKNYNPKSKDYYGISGKLDTQEFNVLYKLDENFTVFTGVNQAKSKYGGSGLGEYTGDTKTNWQFGVTGQTAFGDKTTGYATIAAGQDSSAYKIGVAYAIDKNLDFDLFYGQNKYDKVKYNNIIASGYGSSADYTVKGVGYGLTYKF